MAGHRDAQENNGKLRLPSYHSGMQGPVLSKQRLQKIRCDGKMGLIIFYNLYILNYSRIQ